MTEKVASTLSQLSQSSESVKRAGQPGPTDGRTDGRTEKVVTEVETLSVVDAGRARGIESIGEVLSRGVLPTGERHPVIRWGERDEIPRHVRSAVWFRDHGDCEFCGSGSRPQSWHLDHITPWSAGGPDETANLRVLCETHNMERGNGVDPFERPRLPATWWCTRCFSFEETRRAWAWTSMEVSCPDHFPSIMACRVGRAYMLRWKADRTVSTWHQRPLIESDAPLVVAFCAHCDAPGLTDQTL